MKALRQWVVGSLIGAGLLLIAALFSGLLGAVLGHLGDEVGARAALAVTASVAAGFLITQILLTTLLALAFLQKNMNGEAFTDGTPHF